MGKTRIIAETGAGQHGVATATACALLGLECIVYMGTEDMRRQAPNVQRMELLGATVVPVEAGARTLKEAVSAAIRDWVANVADTHYVIGSCRRARAVPGARARPAAGHRRRGARADRSSRRARCPIAVIACVGGGSNAIGMFVALRRRRRRRARRRRGGGGGHRDRPPRRAADRRRPRRRPARRLLARSCRTRTARSSRRTRSRPGSTIPAPAPSTPTCATPAAPATWPSTDARRWTPSSACAELEGIIPALESAHAVAWVLGAGRVRGAAGTIDLICLSGRGDKDLAEALDKLGRA